MKFTEKNIEVKHSNLSEEGLTMGQMFLHEETDNIYILSMVDFMSYALISIKWGSRYSDPKKNISDVFSGNRGEFLLVSHIDIKATV